jgi:hypothetical protein
MKTTTLLILVAAIGLLNSCAPGINIAFQVPKNFDRVYVSESTSNTESMVMGMDVDNTTINNMSYRMNHLGQNAQGEDQFRITYETILYEQSTMGKESIYDSEKPERTTDPNLESIYGAMLSESFVVNYDPKGQITGAEGLEAMMTEMLKVIPEEAQATVETLLGGDAMLQAMKSTTSYYPEVAKKKVGDTWTNSNDITIAGMKLLLDNTYKLVEVKGGQAKIEVTGEIATDPEAPGMEMPGIKMKFDLQGTQEGFLYIDAATSWMQRMELNQSMDGKAVMTMEQAGGMEMDMDMTIGTTQVVEVKE